MSRFSGPKRVYDKEDITKFKVFISVFEDRSISVGSKKNKCKLIQKKRVTNFSQNKISNPVHGKYKDILERKEPPVLLAYQIAFIIQRGFLPMYPFNLSHVCGRKNCYITDHLIVEIFYMNSRRQKCHNALIKESKIFRLQGIVGGMRIFCESCEHGRTRRTKCFYNF